MTYQPPLPTNGNDEPELILSCYPTLEGLISCASDPEPILALYLENLKNRSSVTSTSAPINPSSSSSSASSSNNNIDPNNKPSTTSNNDSDDDEHQKALDLASQRRLRIIAWYLYFVVGDDEIWERERGEKLEEVERGKANVHEEEKDAEEDAEDDNEEDEDEDEEEECMKRMMLRQEVFADWKAGKHGFFYDDENMPELGVDDDRIYKMSLIREEPSWQGFLEKLVREKKEFDRMENGNQGYDSDE
ncbi:hypothetical protein B0T20DRAFT_403263 [Sordaria brevicollis]|uniref:Uncharacterized protein n=1 Tax=Sordaria brevicollis TaxID=83679 RepID=A0AAE0PLF5_SORBR|nr:hypothetical protein B0T20DRAFT_403263 [Sordaria brevicollis]